MVSFTVKFLSCKLQNLLEKSNYVMINFLIGVLVVELRWFTRLDILIYTHILMFGRKPDNGILPDVRRQFG